MTQALLDINSSVVQDIRRNEQDSQYKYGELTLETQGRDCDGPHFTKPLRRLLVTEEEALFFLADHFGLRGWTFTRDGDEMFFHRQDQHEEGWHRYEAHLYFPKEQDNESN